MAPNGDGFIYPKINKRRLNGNSSRCGFTVLSGAEQAVEALHGALGRSLL
jgi:hypothetical protein